jgi:hypothetical protein
MSPINQETIRVETWTVTRDSKLSYSGQKQTQVLAEGDSVDPGYFVFKHGVLAKNVGHVRNPDLLVDVFVDKDSGRIIHRVDVKGIWRRYKDKNT